MLSTFTDYRSITANLQKSLSRTASEPASKNEIKYFQDHIGQVKTVDDFLGNTRLYTFAMKAFGLDDMIYAKGFMRKVLLGEADANGRVLVTRLQDERYRDFAAAFNFRTLGDDPNRVERSDDPEIQDILDKMAPKQTLAQKRATYDTQTQSSIQYLQDMSVLSIDLDDIVKDSKLSQIVRMTVGLPPASEYDDVSTQKEQIQSKFDPDTFQDAYKLSTFIGKFIEVRYAGRNSVVDPYFRPAGTYADSDAELEKQTEYFRDKASAVHTAQDIVADPALTDVVVTALGLPADTSARRSDEQAKLIGQKLDVASLQDPKKLSQILGRFKDARHASRAATVDAYVQKTLESEAGNENEGVRLALYFRRKAPTVTSAYGFLADPALAEVVRTTLGLPPEAAKSSIDGQANLINRKFSVASLKDPVKLDQFIKRFTILWDAKNDTASTPALSLLNSSSSGLDPDVLLKLQGIRQGGR
ncbi:DUF1217 domain-containing protein [Methylobacterium sp. PvR107]|uniref:DUF1217 domain-containing protein n=1 Tax=Methylobacterium sp. PvR107 TaxID=2806597 RepID=UPI001AEA4FEC|nr:DUF1217 domain-containing protein [Methylobacterium sp. PvR107]MBP1178199.1 hypothetical protein [Methylobacterium sp. PvR107]